MIRFSDNDLGYLAWLGANPDGFVLNVNPSPDPRCVVLHRASCPAISNATHAPGAYTGRNHRKICASTEAELKLAAKDEGRCDGTFSMRCCLCRPMSNGSEDGVGRLRHYTEEAVTKTTGSVSVTVDALVLAATRSSTTVSQLD
jgi:hypothetical protein